MIKRIIYFIIITGQFLVSEIVFSQEQITILHTNDIHGNYLHKKTKKRKGREQIEYSGLSLLNSYVRQIQEETDNNYLLFDAGDFMTGNPICDIEYEGVKGGALIYFFNRIGYHGLTIGNHEFDVSVDNCQKLIKLCKFPVVSSNVFYSNGELFAPEAYHIYEKGNLRVGVIGAIVHDLAGYLNLEQKKQIYSEPPLEIVESIAEKIDPETDLIIVLTHIGLQSDRRLAARLSDRVDIIIGGHSHNKLTKPSIIKGKLIVQAASNCRQLGRLDITVAADTIQSFNGRLIFLKDTGIERDSAFEQEIDKYTQIIDRQYNKVIGELTALWNRNNQEESAVGNFITDCIRESAQADFAVLNSGGIRSGLHKGPIKAIDIKRILPFTNPVCVFEMSGRQIMNIIRKNIRAAAYRTHGILQVSGLHYRWFLDEVGNIVIPSATIKDEPIDPHKIYKGASVDYVMANTKKYMGINEVQFENLYLPIADIVIKAIERKKIITPQLEDRIVRAEI